MKHIRKFNENKKSNSNFGSWNNAIRELGNMDKSKNSKYQDFIDRVNALLDDEDGGFTSTDLLSEIGDLCNEFDLSAKDIKKVIDSGKIINDNDRLLNIIYEDSLKEETVTNNSSNLESEIADLIFNDVYLRDVPYSMEDGAQELDPNSVNVAAASIIKLLKSKGII